MVFGAASRTLAGESESLIDDEFADARVTGSENGKANNDTYGTRLLVCMAAKDFDRRHTKRDQLGRDILELAEALRNGVACK